MLLLFHVTVPPGAFEANPGTGNYMPSYKQTSFPYHRPAAQNIFYFTIIILRPPPPPLQLRHYSTNFTVLGVYIFIKISSSSLVLDTAANHLVSMDDGNFCMVAQIHEQQQSRFAFFSSIDDVERQRHPLVG